VFRADENIGARIFFDGLVLTGELQIVSRAGILVATGSGSSHLDGTKRLVESPVNTALSVFEWIISRRVHEYLDEAGRPVGEGRSKAFQKVHTEMRPCPYAGVRQNHDKPMNLTALRQMPPWFDVLTMLSWLGQRYSSAHRRDVTTSGDLSQVTGAGIFLADFLALRRDNPLASGKLPVLISGVYKVCLGFQLAHLVEGFSEHGEPAILPDAKDFYSYIEKNELLIGEEEVCSGPAAMIIQAYEAIVKRPVVSEELLPPPCPTLRIDWDRFDSFARYASSIWRDLVMYALKSLRFCPQLDEPQLPSGVQGRFNVLLRERAAEFANGRKGLVIDLARGVLEESGTQPIAQPTSPIAKTAVLVPSTPSWLSKLAGPGVEHHLPLVTSALHTQLADYGEYQNRMLANVNRNIGFLLEALGVSRTQNLLTLAEVGQVCGFNSLDWSE